MGVEGIWEVMWGVGGVSHGGSDIPAVYCVGCIRHGEKGRGRQQASRFPLGFLFLVGLCAIAVVCSFCGECLLLLGFRGGVVWGCFR